MPNQSVSLSLLFDLFLDVSVEFLPGDVLGIEAWNIVYDLTNVLICQVKSQLFWNSPQVIELQKLFAFWVDQGKDGSPAILVVRISLNKFGSTMISVSCTRNVSKSIISSFELLVMMMSAS